MNIMRVLLALVCFVLVGCSSPTIYQLAVSPDGDAMRRELVVVNGGDVDETLGLLFPVAFVEEGVTRHSGSFDKIPQDIGGSGTWLRVASPMGDLTFYAERFRGNDDLVGQVEARLLATDRVADLLIAWFESEMNDDAGWPTLRGFMDTQLRHDMKNLSLYIFELERQGVETEQWGPAYIARVGQYLADRDYLDENDLRVLMSWIIVGDPELSDEASVSLLQRAAARRMGLEDGAGIPESLDFLLIEEGVEASWEAYLSSPACAELVGEWDAEGLEETPEADDLNNRVAKMFMAAIGMEFEIFSVPDQVQLVLDCGSEPMATNGEWDDEAQRVTWSGQVRKRFGLPLFFYACWAEPDAAYQEAHLGSVLLEGEPLVEIVAWYAGLPAESRERWDGFVASLAGLDSSGERFEAVRAADERDASGELSWGYTHLIKELGLVTE